MYFVIASDQERVAQSILCERFDKEEDAWAFFEMIDMWYREVYEIHLFKIVDGKVKIYDYTDMLKRKKAKEDR